MLTLLPLLLACAAPVEPPGALALARCHVPGVAADTLCGELPRPEAPADPSGRALALRVVVVPARGRQPLPDPVVFLAGGPGQGATEVIAGVLPALVELREHRDLVFMDQRGTGASNPLDCEEFSPLPLLGRGLESGAGPACLAQLEGRADLRYYGTDHAVADLEALATALGAAQVNVVGGSYGTRLGLEWARRHPERVRTLVLDGVVPADEPILQSGARDAQAALDAVVRDCAQSPECSAAFPDPAGDLARALARLPEQAVLRHPRTGEPAPVEITPVAVLGLVRGALYSPELSSLLPLALQHAAAGDWGPLAGVGEVLAPMGQSMSAGLQMTVMCSEDVPRYRLGQSEGTFLGDTLLSVLQAECAGWPAPPADPALWAPVQVDTPALLLSGALDPVTPPRLAEQAARTLPRAVHGVAPGAGHGVMTLGCAPELIGELVRTGTERDLELDCLGEVDRAPFWASPAGPPLGAEHAAR